MTIIVTHQLKGTEFYIPSWEIKHLFIGTFNPAGGDKVNYYYGRERNQTWNLLSQIFNEELKPRQHDFFEKIKTLKIACIDMIDTVEVYDQTVYEVKIIKGYMDSAIINNKTKRCYNTNNILNLIQHNPNVYVYSTWGTGANLQEWKCEINKIPKLINLVSPSLLARVPEGVKKFDYMLQNWRYKILAIL